jgi:hypothetical protein
MIWRASILTVARDQLLKARIRLARIIDQNFYEMVLRHGLPWWEPCDAARDGSGLYHLRSALAGDPRAAAQDDIGTHRPHTGKDLMFAVSSVPRAGNAIGVPGLDPSSRAAGTAAYWSTAAPEGTSAVAMFVAWLKRNIQPILPVTLGNGNPPNHC